MGCFYLKSRVIHLFNIFFIRAFINPLPIRNITNKTKVQEYKDKVKEMAVKALQVVLGEMLAVVLLLPGDAGYSAMICCYW